jgi:nitrogenase molybdenum-iron protein alpha/beta subunit
MADAAAAVPVLWPVLISNSCTTQILGGDVAGVVVEADEGSKVSTVSTAGSAAACRS